MPLGGAAGAARGLAVCGAAADLERGATSESVSLGVWNDGGRGRLGTEGGCRGVAWEPGTQKQTRPSLESEFLSE